MSFVKKAVNNFTGKTEAKRQSKKAREAIQAGSAAATDYVTDARNRALSSWDPYARVGTDNLAYYVSLARQPRGSARYIGEMESLGKNFRIEDDPIYQAQADEMRRLINARSASQGNAYSSNADDALVRNIAPLMSDSYNRRVNLLQDLYTMTNANEGETWNRANALMGMGTGATAAQAGIRMDSGNALANIATGQASGLANNSYYNSQLGQIYSPMNQYGALAKQGYDNWRMFDDIWQTAKGYGSGPNRNGANSQAGGNFGSMDFSQFASMFSKGGGAK